MTVKCNVLVGVCGLAIDVEVERAVRIANDGDIKHSNSSVLLNFFGPLYARVNGIEVIVEWLNVVVVNGGDGVVGFPEPEEDGLTGTDGVVASGILGKGFSLKVFHIDVRQWAAGGFAHAKSLELPIVVASPSKVG